MKNILTGGSQNNDKDVPIDDEILSVNIDTKISGNLNEHKKSFRKTLSTSQTDDFMKNKNITDPELLDKLESLVRPITREVINFFIDKLLNYFT